MKISTIIPVYNDGKHVERAVESAIKQPEVFEVVLIEDGSTDNSLEICQMLSEKHEKVSLYTHPKNKNMGASASRNLGIEKSKYDFISFLDADDWYLDNRFVETKNVFEQNPDAEGVYDAVGTNFQDEHNKKIWLENRERLLTAPSKRVSPDDFLLKLITENVGCFHTNGIVLKKSVFEKVGYFDPRMKLSEDMHLWFRLMSVCKLYPGDIENARAMRFCHDGNRFLKDIKKLYAVRKLYWLDLFEWSLTKKLPRKISSLILLSTLLYKSNLYRPTKTARGFSFKKIVVLIFNIIKNFFKYPAITTMMIYWGLLRFINLVKSKFI